jgi:transposase
VKRRAGKSRIVRSRRAFVDGAAGGTSKSRKVSETVEIWRPAGVFAVRNTNGRWATPAYNRVLGPDPTNMMEVGVNGKRVIGVDIGKRWLDVAYEDGAGVERHSNEAAAIHALVARFDVARDIVVFERCGGYEREFEAALAARSVQWAVVHSAAVKAFRRVEGIKAKTDTIDARLLRAFGRNRLDAGSLRIGRRENVTLNALIVRMRQLKAALHAEQCRRETAAIASVRGSIERMIAHLQDEFAAVAAEVARHESNDPSLALKEAVMCKRIGVAQTTARALLAELPEIGELHCKEITSLGGLAPRVHRSGRTQLRRGLVHGRASVKPILFNPARTAMRWDPEIKAFCKRLRARGKPGKVIMVAVMRKLLVQLNAAVRDALRETEVLSPAALAAA